MNIFDKKQLAFLKAKEDEEKQLHEIEKLDARFSTDTPFIIKHKKNRQIAVPVSIILNSISAMGAAYSIKVMFEALPVWAMWLLAVSVLALLEVSKRKASDLFWDHWYATKSIHFGYAILNFVVFLGISVGGTGSGIYFAAKDTDPGAATLRTEISVLKEEIADYKGQRNSKGQIFWKIQNKILPMKEEQLSKLEAELATVTKGANATAAINPSYFANKAKFRIIAGVGLNILLEIIFEFLMAFMSRYDYRKHQALKLAQSKAGSASSASSGTNTHKAAYTHDIDQLKLMINQLQEEFQNYAHPSSNHIGYNIGEDGNINVATCSNNNQDDDLGAYKEKLVNEFESIRDNYTDNRGKITVSDVNLERLDRAFRNTKSSYHAWASKLRIGHGKDETNLRHMNELSKEMSTILEEIKQLRAQTA